MSSWHTGVMVHDTIRVAIADDSYLLREAIARVIDQLGDVKLVASCEDGDQLWVAIEREAPDVVIVDIRMPPAGDSEGIRIATRLRDLRPQVGVVVLSQYAEPRYGIELMRPSGEGRAYLLKERVHSAQELGAAIRTVVAGGSVIDSAMVDVLVGALRQRRGSPLNDLTVRERHVLAQMAQGKSNSVIADQLNVTKGAVEKYIGTVFLKLGLPNDELVSRRVAAVLLYLAEEPD